MMKKLERRGYQFKILSIIRKAALKDQNVLLELDAGLGKRIVSYLLYKRLSSEERALMVTPTTSSLEDTVSTFKRLKENEEDSLGEIGYIYGKTRGNVRQMALKEAKFVISTPISLAHTLEKIEENTLSGFDYIILNEVDKIVRRTGVRRKTKREDKQKEDDTIKFQTAKDLEGKIGKIEEKPLFTYPWNVLRKKIPGDTCIIGMSATLRDKHMVKDKKTGKFESELKTIVEDFIPEKKVKIVRMDSLIRSTDLESYIPKNISLVRPIGISDPHVEKITTTITKKLDEIKEKIYEEYPELFEKKDFKHVKRGFSLLPSHSVLRRNFFKFALLRKFVVASVPDHYKQFLYRFPEKSTREKLLPLVPQRSHKITKTVELAKSWTERNKKVAIMVSYIKTASKIKKKLENSVETFLITGDTYNRHEILETFKESENSTLILTPVGERDLDLTSVNLLIIHDVVNTVKTMYQRLKRARGALIIFLYYKGTHEKMKVYSVLDKIQKRYAWTTKVSI